jgi:hypothetical protein
VAFFHQPGAELERERGIAAEKNVTEAAGVVLKRAFKR